MPEKNTAVTASPVLARDSRTRQDAAERARELGTELARVIKFMNERGITAAGIGITGAEEVTLNRSHVSGYDGVHVERLLSARAVIRKAAEESIGLYALPDAMLVLHGVGVTLLGDDRPGTLKDSGRCLTRAAG